MQNLVNEKKIHKNNDNNRFVFEKKKREIHEFVIFKNLKLYEKTFQCLKREIANQTKVHFDWLMNLKIKNKKNSKKKMNEKKIKKI